MTKLPKLGTWVMVTWGDAKSVAEGEWATKKQVRKDTKPAKTRTVGKLIAKSASGISVASSQTQGGYVCHVMFIPFGMVYSVKTLIKK